MQTPIGTAIAGFALLLLATPAFAQAWRDIDCAESRLLVDFERPHCSALLKERRGYSGALIDHYSVYGWRNGKYRQVLLTAPRARGYLNPELDRDKALKAMLLKNFEWLDKADNWSTERTGASILYVSFDDDHRRPCMGFRTYRELKNKGYRYGLTGYFCQEANRKPTAENLAEFLAGVGID